MGKFPDDQTPNNESITLRKRISKVNYHDLGNQIKKKRLLNETQYFPQKSHSKPQIKRQLNSDQQSKWTELDKKAYQAFIKANKEIFQNPSKRASQTYTLMSQFIETKTPSQCKNYHQKHYKKVLESMIPKEKKDDSWSLSTRGSGVENLNNIGSPMIIEESDFQRKNSLFDDQPSIVEWKDEIDLESSVYRNNFSFNPSEFLNLEDKSELEFFKFDGNSVSNNLLSNSLYQSEFQYGDFIQNDFLGYESNAFEDFDLLL